MKHRRRALAGAVAATAIIAGAMVDVRAAEACYDCDDDTTTNASSNCYAAPYGGARHYRGSPTWGPPFINGGRAIDHGTGWYCNSCNVHPTCVEPQEADGDEEEEGDGGGGGGMNRIGLFDGQPAKLLAAVENRGDDYFVEQSSGRPVVLNCRGEIAHQYKLTKDQIAVFNASRGDVAASD